MEIQIEPLNLQDVDTIDCIVSMVNAVYSDSEKGLWKENYLRVSSSEMADAIRSKSLYVANFDKNIAGLIKLCFTDADLAEFSLLTVGNSFRSHGIGRALVGYVEKLSLQKQAKAIQLEVLKPVEGIYEHKEFLTRWYKSMGYRFSQIEDFQKKYPAYSNLLAVPCRLHIYKKQLPG